MHAWGDIFYLARGRTVGGASPGLNVSAGTRAAVPAPPPAQPSIGASHSIPEDFTPPTVATLTRISSVPLRTSAPGKATTTSEPTTTFGAFVTIETWPEIGPASTIATRNLSFLGTGSSEIMQATTISGEVEGGDADVDVAGAASPHDSHDLLLSSFAS